MKTETKKSEKKETNASSIDFRKQSFNVQIRTATGTLFDSFFFTDENKAIEKYKECLISRNYNFFHLIQLNSILKS